MDKNKNNANLLFRYKIDVLQFQRSDKCLPVAFISAYSRDTYYIVYQLTCKWILVFLLTRVFFPFLWQNESCTDIYNSTCMFYNINRFVLCNKQVWQFRSMPCILTALVFHNSNIGQRQTPKGGHNLFVLLITVLFLY